MGGEELVRLLRPPAGARQLLLGVTAAVLPGCTSSGRTEVDTGAYALSWQGRLHHTGDARPRVSLNEIPRTDRTFAIGPLAGLRGEITVIDGEPYIARIDENGEQRVGHGFDPRAPFLVYGNVREWRGVSVPADVKTVQDLEGWLETLEDFAEPFPFKITTATSTIQYHVIHNAEPGYKTSLPHSDLMRRFELNKTPVTLLGVYSTEHGGIFTHRGAATPIHMVAGDGQRSGHVDGPEMGDEARLFVPAEGRAQGPRPMLSRQNFPDGVCGA